MLWLGYWQLSKTLDYLVRLFVSVCDSDDSFLRPEENLN
jgi:hypothetical protein